ncbi:MAG: hypothetical protein ACFE8N_15110, partial [Promethearchaeota archaeon]
MYSKPIVLYSEKLDEIDRNLMYLMDFMDLKFAVLSVEELICNRELIKEDNRNHNISILSSAKSIANLLKYFYNNEKYISSLINKFRTILIYGIDSTMASCNALQIITENKYLSISQFSSNNYFYEINEKFKKICGPFAGLSLGPINNKIDYGINLGNKKDKISSLVSIGKGSLFIMINKGNCNLYFIACKNILNITDMVSNKLDVNKYFSQIIPVLMYIKNNFGYKCWKSNKNYACLIIDDPLLTPKYGFLDFKKLLHLMNQYRFHANIAFIPWNYKRSDPIISKLFVKKKDKLTISIHGCDHIQNEFGSNNLSELNIKVQLAKRRMKIHYEKTGIEFDHVMVFPQGVFSSQAIKILKYNNLLAGINTEVITYGQNENKIEISQLLQIAITKYDSFPVFVRRYPSEGIENFAFDIFMGKPCLIVVHHGFFKRGYEELISLIQKINTLESNLVWKGLSTIANNIHLKKTES